MRDWLIPANYETCKYFTNLKDTSKKEQLNQMIHGYKTGQALVMNDLKHTYNHTYKLDSQLLIPLIIPFIEHNISSLGSTKISNLLKV